MKGAINDSVIACNKVIGTPETVSINSNDKKINT